MKIGILGMGGVGCFIGAKLSEHYEKDDRIKIIFICRNETKDAIKRNGLTLITGDKTINAKPDLVSDDVNEIGLLDILLVTTKSYSIPTAIKAYRACLKKETLIIPIQNGVNAKSLIEAHSGHDPFKILEGCIYVASNIVSPGVVKHLGGPGKIFFGNTDSIDYTWVENIGAQGGLDISYTKNIKEIVWKKYLFVSPLSAMTTALGWTFGQILEDPAQMGRLESMMQEVKAIALSRNILLTDQDVENSLAMLSNFPYQAKSSLQLDVENHKLPNEKDVLVDYIIENGKERGIGVRHYEEMNEKIARL